MSDTSIHRISVPVISLVTRSLVAGYKNNHTTQIAKELGVKVYPKIRDNEAIDIEGDPASVEKAKGIIQRLDQKAGVIQQQYGLLGTKSIDETHWGYVGVELRDALKKKQSVTPDLTNKYAQAVATPKTTVDTTKVEKKTSKRQSVQFLGGFEPRNLRQAIVYEACMDASTGADGQKTLANSFVYAAGPAGGGKTYSPLRAGLELYSQGLVGEILIIRPDTSVSKNKHAALPGKARDKIQPFVKGGIESNIPKIVKATLQDLEKTRVVRVLTPADERGETYDNAFVLVDEAQNLSVEQAKLLVGRIGEGSIMVFTGDIGGEQNDLTLQLPGLVHLVATQGQGAMTDKVLSNRTAFAKFTEEDSAARNGILPNVLNALNNPPEEYSIIMEKIMGLKPNSALAEAIEEARKYGENTLKDQANATFSRYEARLKGNYPQFFSNVTRLKPKNEGPDAKIA